jgi:hypothetical protein
MLRLKLRLGGSETADFWHKHDPSNLKVKNDP